MESYTLLYFHFFLLACFQGSVMFYRVSALHSLVWLNNVPLFGSTIFCYPFINLCTFGWFPFFTLMNNGALSICVQFLMWMYVFISFGDITRHRIAESYGNSVFNILEELANCFPKWPPFYIPINHVGQFLFSTSIPILVLGYLFDYAVAAAILVALMRYLMILIHISLMTLSIFFMFISIYLWRTVCSNILPTF